MSQKEKILKHLLSGKSITPIQALNKFGCFRLGARIHNLRSEGYDIISKLVKKDNKYFSKYCLNNNIEGYIYDHKKIKIIGNMARLKNISKKF